MGLMKVAALLFVSLADIERIGPQGIFNAPTGVIGPFLKFAERETIRSNFGRIVQNSARTAQLRTACCF